MDLRGSLAGITDLQGFFFGITDLTEQYDLLAVLDGLYPNAPFIRLLKEYDMRFIIGIKEGYVLVQVEKLKTHNALQVHQWVNKNGEKCIAKYYNSLIINGQNQDIEVNYFQYEQFNTKGVRTFYSSWVTDLPIEEDNIQRELWIKNIKGI